MSNIFERTSRNRRVIVTKDEVEWLDKRLEHEVKMKDDEIEDCDKFRIRCDLVDYMINDIDAGCWHCRRVDENSVFACKQLCRIVCKDCKLESEYSPDLLGNVIDGVIYPHI